MNIKYVIILLLGISNLSCTNEDKTQTEKQSPDTKVFVKEKKKVEDGSSFYDKARARMEAKALAKRELKWARNLAEQQAFAQSNYIHINGKIARVRNITLVNEAAKAAEQATFILIKKALAGLNGSPKIQEGSKISVTESKGKKIVTFSEILKDRRNGASYRAKVTFDAQGDNIIGIMGS